MLILLIPLTKQTLHLSPPKPRNSMHIEFIENELEERDRTIEKLTLWVLDIELSTLDGLSESNLLKLRNFLINGN
ncbi:MAG: hypothetical protein COB24_12905 [Hyphomicrobiales bacterium]|nr:MAG: hypothetical protein COB24_12905 [Hyphomicrobiales bacterium]